MTKMYKCPIEGCTSFTVGEPNLPCARHGVDMVVDMERIRLENQPTSTVDTPAPNHKKEEKL